MTKTPTAGNTALDHFGGVAKDYQRRTQTFPWSWIKRRETAAIAGLLGRIDGLRALDLGCGTGHYTSRLIERGAREVVAVDGSRDMLAQLPPGQITPVHADAADLALDEPVDVAVSAGMLEFVADPRRVLERACAAVRPNGRLIVLYPPRGLITGLYGLYHRSHGTVVTTFGAAEFEDLARSAGWTVGRSRSVWPLARVVELTRPR